MNNLMKIYLGIWIFVFVSFGVLFLPGIIRGEITGYIPLTGILEKEGVEDNLVFPKLGLTFGFIEEDIRRIWDLTYYIEFESEDSFHNQVDLDYLIIDSSGKLVYSDEEKIIVVDDLRIERNVNINQLQKLDLKSGTYTFIVTADFLGETKVFHGDFNLDVLDDGVYSVKQLFDITMELDYLEFSDLSNLHSTVTFRSFGIEPTPVNMSFIIYDLSGRQVYRVDKMKVVETEAVHFEDFSGIDISPGKYSLVLITDYNSGVIDPFPQNFTYQKKISLVPFILSIFVILLGIFFIFKRKFIGFLSNKKIGKLRK